VYTGSEQPQSAQQLEKHDENYPLGRDDDQNDKPRVAKDLKVRFGGRVICRRVILGLDVQI
jgi:hypothetical protein